MPVAALLAPEIATAIGEIATAIGVGGRRLRRPGNYIEFEQFEWNEEKRLSNIKERGVDFKDAAAIFEGPCLVKEDTRENYGEQRFRALGKGQ